MSSLFNIVGEFQQLYDLATSEEEQAEQVFVDTLDSLKGELATKVDGYAAVMTRLDMEEKKADELVKKYTAIRNARKNARKRMNEAVLYACDALNVDKLTGDDVTLKVKKNGGMQPLIIDEPDNVPDNLTKVTVEPDNGLIREYLKDHECKFAHLEERGRHVEIV